MFGECAMISIWLCHNHAQQDDIKNKMNEISQMILRK